ASAHPLKDSRVIDFVADQPRQNGVLLRIRKTFHQAENFEVELFRLGARKDRVPDRAHSGFDLVKGEKLGLRLPVRPRLDFGLDLGWACRLARGFTPGPAPASLSHSLSPSLSPSLSKDISRRQNNQGNQRRHSLHMFRSPLCLELA